MEDIRVPRAPAQAHAGLAKGAGDSAGGKTNEAGQGSSRWLQGETGDHRGSGPRAEGGTAKGQALAWTKAEANGRSKAGAEKEHSIHSRGAGRAKVSELGGAQLLPPWLGRRA